MSDCIFAIDLSVVDKSDDDIVYLYTSTKKRKAESVSESVPDTRTKTSKTDGEATDNTCSICLCDMGGKDLKKVARLECMHYFHKACIMKWYSKKKECPMCRQFIYNNSIVTS